MASPTQSTTTSAPSPSVSLRTSATGSAVRWFTATAAPRPTAVSSLASDPLVTMARAPRWTAICSAAIPTPPPTPQISTVSDGRSFARVGQHPPGRQGRQREGRGLRPRHPFGHAGEIGRGHDHQLGDGARKMLAQDREVRAERLFAFPARRAGAAGEARIDQDSIADRPSPGRGSHRDDLTGAVGADHMRKGGRRVGKPVRHPEIEPIQRRAPDPDQDIIRRADGGWRDVLNLELVQPAGARERQR